MHAPGLITGAADLTGVVGCEERTDHEVPDRDVGNRIAYPGDRSDVLVTHRHVVDRVCAAVGPQIGTTNAGGGQSDDGVGRLEYLRIRTVRDPHLAGPVENDSTHEISFVCRHGFRFTRFGFGVPPASERSTSAINDANVHSVRVLLTQPAAFPLPITAALLSRSQYGQLPFGKCIPDDAA